MSRPSRPEECPPDRPAAHFDRLAMRIVSALAKLGRPPSGTAPLVRVESAQVSGVSYANIGDAGLEFLEDWARGGAKACVPTTMNPCGMDVKRWKELGIPEGFAEEQNRIISALQRLGVLASLTCTPYEGYSLPKEGEHLAWSESSAVSCANSLFGARTNREGGPSALAAAICGKTPLTGYHLDENRLPTHLIRLRCPVRTVADYGALGLLVGAQVEGGVPYISFPEGDTSTPHTPRQEGYKALAAAMAAAGSVALFHIHGVTPEAKQVSHTVNGLPEIVIESLDPAYRLARCGCPELDAVAIGCPHASIEEVEHVAGLVRGRRLKTRFWVTTSRHVYDRAKELGLQDDIERAGGTLLSDMCLLVAPLAELGIRHVATNSAKTAYYLRSREGASVCFGSLAECIEASATGKWHDTDLVEPPSSHLHPVTKARAPRPQGSLSGWAIVEGHARGEVLCSRQPIGFFGHVNPESGVITEPGHELAGQCIAGKILAFPHGKGSTVGSYTLYALKKAGRGPLAIVNQEMDPIVAAGAVVAGIPAVDGVDTSLLRTGQTVEVRDGDIRIV